MGTTFGYNGFGELTSHATTIAGSPVYSAVLTRDNGGRISQQSETLAGVPTQDAYGYDLAGRLQTVTRNGALAVTYGYDGNGNRTSVTTAGGTTSATYDAQDRIQTWGPRTYTHAPHGDVASWTDSTTTQMTALSYDVQGNLRQVTRPGTTVTYTVDGRNRRIGTAVNGTPVQGFLWQGQLRPVAELDGNGTLVSRFVYGTRINVPEYLVKNGTTYRIVTDHLGSVRLVVDTTSNTVVQALTYDPWGVVVQDTNPGFQPFGYAGGLYDPRTGLVRFGVRDYDPTIGRWLAKDPVGFWGHDPNLYSYAFSDPVSSFDPTGLRCLSSWERALVNFDTTNQALPGILSPTGLGFLLGSGKAFATAYDSTTLFRWARSGFGGAVLRGVSFTALETGVIAGATQAVAFVAVGAAFEVGVGIGSVVGAALDSCDEICR